MESNMENSTNSFRETNLVLQLIQESQVKSKTVMSWSLQKKKDCIFCTVYFVQRRFFNIGVLSQCIVYWVHFQNIVTFTFTKTWFHTLFCLFLKSPKAFGVSLRELNMSNCLAQYNNPILFAILFLTVLIWSFHEMLSPKITPKNFINLLCSISSCLLLITNSDIFKGIPYL